MMAPYLNIRDFGAKGGGRSDDTQALKDAMARAETESGVVDFPAGHYCVHPVKAPSQITLLGYSAWGAAASTITACRLEWSKFGGIALYDSESIERSEREMRNIWSP